MSEETEKLSEKKEEEEEEDQRCCSLSVSSDDELSIIRMTYSNYSIIRVVNELWFLGLMWFENDFVPLVETQLVLPDFQKLRTTFIHIALLGTSAAYIFFGKYFQNINSF